MDLREYSLTAEQLTQATHLACRGLLCYQPFILSDTLITGAGYEFAEIAEGAGLVYCADVPPEYRNNPSVDRHLIDPSLLPKFIEDNQRLRIFYEAMIDFIEEKVGQFSDLTFADLGCCSGYFPLAYSKRGAKQAVGYDAIDYSPTFNLLNSILGTKAEFRHQAYVSEIGAIEDAENDIFDVVSCTALLVHLSDPLQLLACLGRMARKALLVWTYTSPEEEDLVLRFKSINRYYRHKKFPYCFDVVQLSPSLLRQSLELMGFNEIYPIQNPPGGMPDKWCEQCQGYLAIRTDSNTSDQRWSHKELELVEVEVPELAKSWHGYNIVTYKNKVFGIPQSLGSMDISQTDISSLKGIIHGLTVRGVQKEIDRLSEINSETLLSNLDQAQGKLDRSEVSYPEPISIKNNLDLAMELKRLQSQIAAMESSKFWKLRSFWLKLKHAMGLKEE